MTFTTNGTYSKIAQKQKNDLYVYGRYREMILESRTFIRIPHKVDPV